MEFVLEGLHIILDYHYCYKNQNFIQPVKWTAMGSTVAVVPTNLVVAILESRLFTQHSQIYPKDCVDFIRRN